MRGVAAPAIGGCAPNLNGALPVEAAGLPEPNTKFGDVAVAPLAGAAEAGVVAPNVKPLLFGWAPTPLVAPNGDCKFVEPNAGGAATVAGFAAAVSEPKLNMFVLAALVACGANGAIWDAGAVAPNLNTPDSRLEVDVACIPLVPTGSVEEDAAG